LTAAALAALLAAAALLAEPHLLGELRPCRGVIGRHHRIIRRQTPLFAILIRRDAVPRAQMAFSDLNFSPSSKQTMKSGLIDRFTGTAGLSGSIGAAT